jgi:hypothetical protein
MAGLSGRLMEWIPGSDLVAGEGCSVCLADGGHLVVTSGLDFPSWLAKSCLGRTPAVCCRNPQGFVRIMDPPAQRLAERGIGNLRVSGIGANAHEALQKRERPGPRRASRVVMGLKRTTGQAAIRPIL